jgi:chaperone BCS1
VIVCLTDTKEDSVLFASTNYPDKLDAALRRPGRFDVHIAFHHAVHQQAADLFKHFYPLSRISHDSHDTREKIHEKSTSHPFKDQADLDQAADQFADRVLSKNVKVSIATIQGFLLLYKKDPERALDEVEEWAEGFRLEQFPKAGEKEEIIVEAQIEVVEKQDEGVKMNGEDAEKKAMKPKGRSQKMRFQEEEKEIVLA